MEYYGHIELFELLKKHNVEYLIVGGYALAAIYFMGLSQRVVMDCFRFSYSRV